MCTQASEDRIVMAPSGVQKERMVPSDMFILDGKGNVLVEPEARPAPYPPPKLSECAPLFMAVSLLMSLPLPTIPPADFNFLASCTEQIADCDDACFVISY